MDSLHKKDHIGDQEIDFRDTDCAGMNPVQSAMLMVYGIYTADICQSSEMSHENLSGS